MNASLTPWSLACEEPSTWLYLSIVVALAEGSWLAYGAFSMLRVCSKGKWGLTDTTSNNPNKEEYEAFEW